MPIQDYQTENSDNSNKPIKSLGELLIKASTFLFVIVIFLFKDSIHSATNLTKYYYAGSLFCFFASTIVGLYNMLRRDRDRDTKNYIRYQYSFFYRLLNFRPGVTIQFGLFAYGFFAALIVGLKGICPLWPFC